MIIDAAWYDAEGLRVAEYDSIDDLAATLTTAHHDGGSGFAWLGLRMPSEVELKTIEDAFDLPELAVDDARQLHDRPKVERHRDVLLTVVPTARYVDEREEVEFGELFLYAGPEFLISIRYGQAAPLSRVRADLEQEPARLRLGVGAVLQAALAKVVNSYEPVVSGLEKDVIEVERDVFSDSRDQPTTRIYFLIREVLDFLIAIEPLSAALTTLTSQQYSPLVHQDLEPLFRDIQEELDEIMERTRQTHELLNNALTANQAQVSLRQNEDMRKISAWAAIGVFPTAIAGIFGMNLGGIPGDDHPLGFVTVTTLTVLLAGVLYRRFKGAGWL